MFKVSKITGIFASLIMLAITIIFSALHFSEPLFSAILYIGIIGSIVLLVSAISSSELNKFIMILFIVGTGLILIVSILLFIGLKDTESFIAVPLIITADSFAIISFLFEGFAFLNYYRKR